MSPLFVILMVISLINGQAKAQAEIIAIQSIGQIIKLGLGIVGVIPGVLNPDKTRENVELILKNVKQITNRLSSLETHIDTKFDSMLETLINDMEITIDLQNQKAKLLYDLHSVDHFYDDSMKYVFGGPFANTTLVKFTERLLYDTDNLPKKLVDMHDIFNPGTHYHLHFGFLTLILQKTAQNLPTDCKKNISPQQLVYYIYTQLIIAELKSLAALKNVYTTKWILNEKSYNYAPELNDCRENFEQRVRSYHKIFTQQLTQLPRHLRRCHVDFPKRGVDFFELEKFSQIEFINSDSMGDLCWPTCPITSQMSLSSGVSVNIYNCMKMSHTVTACLAESGSPRSYMWWRDYYDTYYGRETSCSKTIKYERKYERIGEGMYLIPPAYRGCIVCACSMDKNWPENNKIDGWRVSLSRQTTDIWNNMVVTGIKFVVHDNTIYLKIQQGNFSNSAMIYDDISWNELNTQYLENGKIEKIKIKNKRITHTQKSFYLDDVMLPEGYVVTGVAFDEVGNHAFRLWVHGTLYNFETGTLDPSNSCWCLNNVCETNGMAEDYARARYEITMNEPDDPTRGSHFVYDLETNKKIKFTHTDIYKDAGQTTIPFFDAQPLVASPPFPLSGIGLYYRGREGFGGYIAPRIYTLDVTNYMKIPEIPNKVE